MAELENWLPVVGFEGLYEVSDLGRVRSLDRLGTHSEGHKRKLQGRVLRPGAVSSGHLTVNLYREGHQAVTKYVHRLVLESFRGTCPDDHEACHYDDDKANNRLDNLRWGTRSDNSLDMVRNGNHNHARKTECKRGHKFTPENIYVQPGGKRSCRECNRARKRAYKARRRAA